MELTGEQAYALLYLEHARGVPQKHMVRPIVAGVLDDLEERGLARRTTDTWVITNEGRRALVSVDGRTRMAVESWTRDAKGGPS